MEESVLLPEEHGLVYVSNPTPKTLSEAVVGKLEMVKESKANITLLELKSDPNRENSPSQIRTLVVHNLGGPVVQHVQPIKRENWDDKFWKNVLG